METTEEWRVVDGYEQYEVSNTGKVRSLNYLGHGKVQFLSLCNDGKGYLQCNLWKNNTIRSFKVHRLVANAFLPKVDGKNEVNHIDGNKNNNDVSNLEWVTREENLRHEHESGLGDKAKEGLRRCSVAKRLPIIVTEISTGESVMFESIHEASRKLNLSATKIVRCLKGKAKTHKGYTYQYVSKGVM